MSDVFGWLSILFNLLSISIAIASIGCLFADVLGNTFPSRLVFWNFSLMVSAFVLKHIGSHYYKKSISLED